MLGSILAVVTGTPADADVLEAAHVLAALHRLHVDVLHPRPDPYRLLAGVIDGPSSFASADLVSAIRQDIDRREVLARRSFADWVDRHAVLPESPGSLPTGEVTAGWRQVTGRYEDALALHGRLASVIVLARPEEGAASQHDLVVAALFDTGRPILCVPRRTALLVPRKAAILWNGSRQAARAVNDAMPLLIACGQAVVLSAGPHEGPDATELVERLVQRGIDARIQRITAPPENLPPILLAALHDAGCGLAVMGGYGHSRWREVLLGGVTHHMLTFSALPLLIAH